MACDLGLEGLRVVVTGGSRGIGAACSQMFAEAGASVCVHFGHDEARAKALVGGLAGEGHWSCGADFSSSAAVESLFGRVADRWETIDCLVNNAGVWLPLPVEQAEASQLAATWDVNLVAPFLCARFATPLLRRSTRATLINITSTAGQRGEAGYSQYAASKGGLASATKSWAVELAPEIRVNAVAPGWVATEMCDEVFSSGQQEEIERGIPRGKVAAASDIAGPVLFLASRWSTHVVGEVLNVNGGAVLCG